MDLEATSLRRREAMIRLLRLGGVSTAAAGLGVWLNGRDQRPAATAATTVRPNFQVPANEALPEMVVIQGDDPARMARRAIQELGGIHRFISRGDVVVIKPNKPPTPIRWWLPKSAGFAWRPAPGGPL